MAQIPYIDDQYINDIIKAAETYNPTLNKTQGIKLRELIKRLRDRMEQGSDDVVRLTGDQQITGAKSFNQLNTKEMSLVKDGYNSLLKNPLNQTQHTVYTLPKVSGELALISDITKNSLGLGDVDNTSDVNKPVSLATQAALDEKARKDGGNASGTWNIDISGNASTSGDSLKWGGKQVNHATFTNAAEIDNLLGNNTEYGIVTGFSRDAIQNWIGLNNSSTLNNNISGTAANATQWNGVNNNFSAAATAVNAPLVLQDGVVKYANANEFRLYLGSPWEGETLQSITNRSSVTTNSISVGGAVEVAGNSGDGPGSGAFYQLTNKATGPTLRAGLLQLGADGDLVNYLFNGTTFFEAFRLKNNTGNLGIGTATPMTKLHTVGGAFSTGNENSYAFRASGSNVNKGVVLGYDDANNNGVIGSVSSGESWTNLIFNPQGGNVGIGTQNPFAKLTVNGPVALQYTTAHADSRSWMFDHDVREYGDFTIQQSTTQTGGSYNRRFYIGALGNVGIGTTTPAAKLDVKTAVGSILMDKDSGTSEMPIIYTDSPTGLAIGLTNFTDDDSIGIYPGRIVVSSEVFAAPNAYFSTLRVQTAPLQANDAVRLLDLYKVVEEKIQSGSFTVAGNSLGSYSGSWTQSGKAVTVIFSLTFNNSNLSNQAYVTFSGLPALGTSGARVAITGQSLFNAGTVHAIYNSNGMAFRIVAGGYISQAQLSSITLEGVMTYFVS